MSILSILSWRENTYNWGSFTLVGRIQMEIGSSSTLMGLTRIK